MATPRTSPHQHQPMQAVPPYDAEEVAGGEGNNDDEEGTISSTRVVVNPQELRPDDDDAASFQLVTPPPLPPQHDLGKSGSGSNASSTFDPTLFVTGVWTPSQSQDWRDDLENGPDPAFVVGRRHGTTLFATINMPRAGSGIVSKETKEDESKRHHDGEGPQDAPTMGPATEVSVVILTEPQEQGREPPAQHCLDRRSTVAKLALLCWCLLAVLAALLCYQTLVHEPIFPTW